MIEKLDQLTVLEKAALLSGENVWESRAVERLGIPRRFHADGPHGLRKQSGSSDHLGLHGSEPATCFPTAATVASSWDVALAERVGTAIGREAAAAGVHVLLGPGLNIKRSPLGGRNFEYFSEDPLLSGTLAAAYVRGIQSQGVAATPKHFAANSQEVQRMASDSVVDERTLREVYLRAFEIVVREAGPWALMSSYNLVNGTYAHEHHDLLTSILREEWGFDGAVISDWGGGNDPVESVRAGGTLEMPSPGYDSARRIVAAVESGELAEADLNARVTEMLRLIERTTLSSPAPQVDAEAHHALARQAAEESAVLLRNEGVLPLAAGTKVAAIGDFAATPRYQGAGSSQVNPTKLGTALEALEASTVEVTGRAAGFRRDGEADPALLTEAIAAARGAEVVLLHLGLPESAESEGIDRGDLKLPANQVELLEALSAVAPVVVILSAGGAVEMPWLTQTDALLHTHLAGQAGAEATVRVLTGAVNPSGRLAETYLFHLEDHPTAGAFPSTDRTAEYREGIYVGYRYTETVGAEVAFPFGYGLSYTTFAYRDLHADEQRATVTVENTGERAGAEVVQLYVTPPDDASYRPAKELRGYAKVFLEPGESREVTLTLGRAAFEHVTPSGRWVVEAGEYGVSVGSHARDARLRVAVQVSSADSPEVDRADLTTYAAGAVTEIDDAAFAALLGRPVPDAAWPTGPMEANHPFARLGQARSPLARLAGRVIAWRLRVAEQKGKPDLNVVFIANMPPRAIAKMTNGMVSSAMVDALLTVINGRHLRGLGQLVSATVANLRANRRTRRALAGVTPEGNH